jgi:hypothetical protein
MRLLEKFEMRGPWVPAFPTDQVRGLKAHGMAKVFAYPNLGPDFFTLSKTGMRGQQREGDDDQ